VTSRQILGQKLKRLGWKRGCKRKDRGNDTRKKGKSRRKATSVVGKKVAATKKKNNAGVVVKRKQGKPET